MKTKLLSLFILLLFVTYACKRDSINDIFEPDDETNVAEFWNHTKTAPILKSAIKDLRLNKNSKSLVSYISKIGRPAWDKSTEFRDVNKANTLLVPIVDDNKKLTAGLLVVSYKGNYYQYHTVLKGRYPKGKNLLSHQQWEELFAALDKELFGKGKSRGFVKERRRTNGMVHGVVGFWCYYACKGDGNGNCVPGTETDTTCEPEYGWYWVDDEGGSGSEASGGSPGSGGGTESGGGGSGGGTSADITNNITDPCLKSMLQLVT